MAAPDLGRMGMEVLSFTIKDVQDEVGSNHQYLIGSHIHQVEYLGSLGKARTAAVTRDADIGTAQARRDAEIREAECNQEATSVRLQSETRTEGNTRTRDLEQVRNLVTSTKFKVPTKAS